jgi:hypothetical protein
MRGAALALLVALAIAVAGCGGGGDSTSTATQTATAQANGGETAAAPGAGKSQSKRDKGSSAQGSGSQSKKAGESGHSRGEVSTPLRVSGGGSKQFRTKGGDNSIQEFGEESDESELQQAAEAVHAFYVARAEEDWAGACSYLAKSMVQQLEQLASQSPQLKDKGCAPFLHAFTRPLPASVWREVTTVDAGSLRFEGEQAFLIYYGAPEKTVYAMPLKREDGGWKVAALAGDALP